MKSLNLLFVLLIISACLVTGIVVSHKEERTAKHKAEVLATTKTLLDMADKLESQRRSVTFELTVGGEVIYHQIPIGNTVHFIFDEEEKFIDMQLIPDETTEKKIANYGQ
jgi:predicted histidine transporter YuiF (NhaC family)